MALSKGLDEIKLQLHENKMQLIQDELPNKINEITMLKKKGKQGKGNNQKERDQVE